MWWEKGGGAFYVFEVNINSAYLAMGEGDFKARNNFCFAWSNFAIHCLSLRSNFNILIRNFLNL